jgi:hypothetical protein
MIVLTSTDKLALQVYQDNTVVESHVSYIDWRGSAATPGSQTMSTLLNTNQSVDIASAPASGVIRAVEYISVFNHNNFVANFNIFYIDNVINPYLCAGSYLTQPSGLHVYTTYTGWQSFTSVSGLREAHPATIYTSSGPNPTGITANTWRYLGLGSSFPFTPRQSPNMFVEMTCVMFNNTLNAWCYLNLAYGTGTPPTNGQAWSSGSLGGFIALANNGSYAPAQTVVLQGVLTGLSMGTAYWVDLICQNPSSVGIANIQYPSCVTVEI